MRQVVNVVRWPDRGAGRVCRLGCRWYLGRWALLALLLALAVASVPAADDSCRFARDGDCDTPGLCEAGTDSTDCSRTADTGLNHDDSPVGLDTRSDTASASEWLVGGALVLAAVMVLLRGVAAPLSLWLAVSLLLMAMGLVGLRFLPFELLHPLYAVAEPLGLSPQTLPLLAGLALLLLVLARLSSTQSPRSTLQTLARAALHPDIAASDLEEISAARRLCQTAAERLEGKLRALDGRFHLYAQYDAVSEPWLQVDRLSTDARGAFVANLRIDFKPQPFGVYPVVVDLAVDDRGRRRRVHSIVDLGPEHIDALVECLKGEGPRFRWRGQRLRVWPWELWRPRQKSTVLESPMMAGLRANMQLLVFGLVGVAVFALWSASPGMVSIAGVVAFFAWRHWYVPAPRYRVVNGCPARPPRLLRGLDSWQAVVRDLGSQREDVVQRLETLLRQRLVGTDEPVQIRCEDIWYEGVGGKVERQQLTISLRRAIVFVRIYPYGSDLFVGWDAHVNQVTWREKPIQSGHRAADGLKVQLVAVTTQVQPINEYDITDANFLLEATHLHLTSLVKDLLREREIDQELDFSIVRESRQGLVTDPAPRRRMFSRA